MIGKKRKQPLSGKQPLPKQKTTTQKAKRLVDGTVLVKTVELEPEKPTSLTQPIPPTKPVKKAPKNNKSYPLNKIMKRTKV